MVLIPRKLLLLKTKSYHTMTFFHCCNFRLKDVETLCAKNALNSVVMTWLEKQTFISSYVA